MFTFITDYIYGYIYIYILVQNRIFFLVDLGIYMFIIKALVSISYI